MGFAAIAVVTAVAADYGAWARYQHLGAFPAREAAFRQMARATLTLARRCVGQSKAVHRALLASLAFSVCLTMTAIYVGSLMEGASFSKLLSYLLVAPLEDIHPAVNAFALAELSELISYPWVVLRTVPLAQIILLTFVFDAATVYVTARVLQQMMDASVARAAALAIFDLLIAAFLGACCFVALEMLGQDRWTVLTSEWDVDSPTGRSGPRTLLHDIGFDFRHFCFSATSLVPTVLYLLLMAASVAEDLVVQPLRMVLLKVGFPSWFVRSFLSVSALSAVFVLS